MDGRAGRRARPARARSAATPTPPSSPASTRYTGEVLVRRPEPRSFVDASGRERRVEPILGYDIRFAAPKSVSLLYAVGSPEVRAAVLRAHDGAVAEGVAYLERHACFVQRGAGGKTIEPGCGLGRDGLPPPLLAGRRPGPPHPSRHRQHDPRRLRRALAQPRQRRRAAPPSGARRRRPATSTRRRFAPT